MSLATPARLIGQPGQLFMATVYSRLVSDDPAVQNAWGVWEKSMPVLFLGGGHRPMPASRIISLQALRFVAASLVVVLHSTDVASGMKYPPVLATIGPAGVDLFFVLSGFIIARITSGATPIDFIASRLTRIYPLYLFLTVFWMYCLACLG